MHILNKITEQENIKKNHPFLFEVDKNLNHLVQKIELLNFINPINIEQEKRNFFASKYNINPVFKYRKIDFDAHKLQKHLFSQPIEKIRDIKSQAFYRDVIYDYSGLIQCIETIGQNEKFYFNALKSFGTPKEKDVQNALFILHFENETFDPEMEPVYDVYDAMAYFKEFMEQYHFSLNIKVSNKITAAAMVQNSTQTLILKKNHKYSANQLKVLANHEIGVHLVTTYNGLGQPLTIFHNGFPNYVETQEGLAVFSEYMSGCLTLYRLKELAYRVVAADSLRKGFQFCDTFDLLHNQYKLKREEAYNITLRAHRGGGFTKDYLYLTGLKKVYDMYKDNKNIDNLMLGKVALNRSDIVNHWKEKGFCAPAKHKNIAFNQNENSKSKLDFILENLK